MEMSSVANAFLDPNFALNLYCKFGRIRETVPKIKLIIEEFRKRSEIDPLTPQLTLKNNFKSIELYEEAERSLDNKDESTLLRVLELYNESLCYAEQSNGEHLTGLYASRAKVYFELKNYECCLENIRLAEASGYPENPQVQLDKLKSDSLQKRSNNRTKNDNKVEIKVNVTPNEQIPFAASCLELKTDSIRGRYITTNEDISPGSVIIVESPFVKVLSSDCIYQRCTNCLAKQFFNLIPCPNCTKAMFCSDKCMQEAFDCFHQFECPIIDCLYDVGGQITIRTFLKAIQSFNSIDTYIEFTQSIDAHNVTAFSFNHATSLSPQQHYHQIHSLSTNHSIRPDMDLFTHAMVAALFYYQLSVHTPFKDLLNKENGDKLIELMFRLELITTINSFNFNDDSSRQDDGIVGTGMYPLSSLINHSCNPNACPKYYDSNLVLYTTQPIKRGESISISYNGSHAFLPKEKRQSFLYAKYHFLCQCVACVHNFPLLNNMQLANIPEIHSNGMNIQLDKTVADNVFQKCCAYLREYQHNYPCREIYSVQLCLSKLISYLLMHDVSGAYPVELCIGRKLGNENPNDIIF